MRTPKDFLAQEAANIQGVLEEILRLKYDLDGSEFFTECQARLKFLEGELSSAADTDHDRLQNISALLTQLADLLLRIERSSIGEYSWPFVQQLKGIAVAVCTEATLTNPRTPPEIYVLAGGMDAYAITPEVNRPSGSSKRIHTIIFPRTLKHFVLLHSILGHEIGHAIWRCSQHQNTLRNILDTHLFNAGVFSNPTATAAWLYSANAPDRVKKVLASIAPGINQNNFFASAASWPAWREEILCDFIGLETFGPSFVAAECNLLYSKDPTGTTLGPSHPPVGCRANYLLTGADLRGLASDIFNDASTQALVQAFWTNLKTNRQPDAWFDVFTSQQIRDAAEAIAGLLKPLTPSLYVSPSEADLSLLITQLNRAVPPVGFELSGDRSVTCRNIDFRHVLYAGWVVSTTPPDKVSFEQINRLCEHGIMQQRAIDLQISP